MTRNEQNRIVAWRLKLLREASEMPRNVAQACGPLRKRYDFRHCRVRRPSDKVPPEHLLNHTQTF
jgi:hypothetical protein